MATMTIKDYAKAANVYVKNNTKIIDGMFARALTTTLDAHAKKITKVKGEFPQFHSILTHVVQGFKAEWTALGTAEFKHKKLQNFHQKVNYPIVPAEILPSALADLYEEDKPIKKKAIVKYILDDLMNKVKDDLEILSITGQYDSADLGTFGKAMDGIAKKVADAVADTTHPAYKIPLNALTDTNIVDEITKFERKLPKFMKKKIKKIFISENNLERYILNYEDKFGAKTTYKEGDKTKTRLGKRVLVGIPDLPDDVIFATIDGNLAKLVDIYNKPAFTDFQVQDYTLKVFMEWWLGYDFLINEAVFVANFTDATEGLGNADLMAKYYPHNA